MLLKFFSFNFKSLASVYLGSKAIMTLVLLSSLSCPAMGMEEDPNKEISRVPPRAMQSPHFGTLSEDLYKKIFSFIGGVSDLVNCNETCGCFHDLLSETLQNRLFILGSTGSGKSSLVHLLMGKPLIAEKYCGGFRLDTEETIPNVDIVHRMCTGTLEVNCIADFATKRLIIDSPGFVDTRGSEEEFKTAKALYKLLKVKGKVSVVLVVPEGEFEFSHGSRFAARFNQVTEMFPDQGQLQNLLSLVVSKNVNCTSIQHLNDSITQPPENLQDRGYDLLQFFVNNPSRFADFSRPKQDGPYSVPANLRVCMESFSCVVNPQVTEPRSPLKGSYGRDGKYREY